MDVKHIKYKKNNILFMYHGVHITYIMVIPHLSNVFPHNISAEYYFLMLKFLAVRGL